MGLGPAPDSMVRISGLSPPPWRMRILWMVVIGFTLPEVFSMFFGFREFVVDDTSNF